MKGDTFDKFLYTYLIFLFFIFFVIGLGGADIFGGDFKDVLSEANTSRQAVLEGTSAIIPPTNTTYEGIMPWMAAAFGGITDAIGVADWFEENLTPFHNFTKNIWFFFKMAYAESNTAWITTLIFAPAGIYLAYGILRLIRGGG